MLVKKERKKRGGGLMDSLFSAIFSETSKKLASSAAEAALKTAAQKGTERIVNSIGKSNKREIPKGIIENINKGIESIPVRKKVENIFKGTSIKFIK